MILSKVISSLMAKKSSFSSEYDNKWYTRQSPHGISVADTLNEIKEFAYKTFEILDQDGNGFISKNELQEALVGNKLDWRERSYVGFLLRRIEDIADAYHEEWQPEEMGISKADIQEYFKSGDFDPDPNE